jgi:hypothetical protein
MTGPYEHVTQSQTVNVLRGRIELDQGDTRMVAAVLGGQAHIELVDDYDAAISALWSKDPVRYVNRRQRLRLTVECDLDEMVIKTGPAEPGRQEPGRQEPGRQEPGGETAKR